MMNNILIYEPGATLPRREPCGLRPGDIECGEAVEAIYATVSGLDPAQPHEAAARIFEWVATAFDLPPDPAHARVEQIMRMIYDGSVGREVLADRARQARKSATLMERVRTWWAPCSAYAQKN